MSVLVHLSVRGAVLVAGVSTPSLVAAGLVAGAGVATVAHLVGADLRALAGSQPGIMQSLVGPRGGSA
jgi:hypothetical protein